MKKTAVFTIASENYFAQVQILLQSLMESNPSWDRFFAVVDEPDEDLIDALKKTNTSLVRMEEIGIPDLNDMKFRYDIMELNTAIKPFVILKLMETYERVVYLDPDICVYHEMSEVNNAFDNGYEFVLTPHFTDYFEDDGCHPDEPDIMRAGIYNFGFFAVKSCDSGRKAVSWWAGKLEKQCINKQAEGIFVDQKWMDLLISRHDKVYVIRDNGYNTAYWNLSHRKATCTDDFYFNGDKLVFFHFSGFNPLVPNEISKHQTRYKMEDIGVAKKLFDTYAEKAITNNISNWRQKDYSYNKFSDGRKINDLFRHLYREDQEVFEKTKGRNPFDCASLFYDQKKWLMPHLINFIHSGRPELGVYYINTRRISWVQWFRTVLETEYKLDSEWVRYATNYYARHLMNFNGDSIKIKKKKKKVLTDGVNLIGYIKSEHGVGEACRLTAEDLSTTSVDWNAYDWELGNTSRQMDSSWDAKIKKDIKHNISIFNINADQMPVAKQHLPAEAWTGYRIGIWYWELTEFPVEWMPSFGLVDEIWAPTHFIKENLEKVSPVPVIYMPPGINREPVNAKYDREYYELPTNAFLFLNFFDALSYTSRKNPAASIKAFQKSFSPDDMNVGMVIKVNNTNDNDLILGELKAFIGAYKNIYIIAQTLTREEVNGLINTCDVAVSLHRSEGLGLLCEEAMFYGKPVIATNWSGNTDFMNVDCSCLVEYTLVPINDYYGTNTDNQFWAEANVDNASMYMIKLYTDKDYYHNISVSAKNHIINEFSPSKCGKRMEARINEIITQKDNWIDRTELSGDFECDVREFTNILTKIQLWKARYGIVGMGKKAVKKILKRGVK